MYTSLPNFVGAGCFDEVLGGFGTPAPVEPLVVARDESGVDGGHGHEEVDTSTLV